MRARLLHPGVLPKRLPAKSPERAALRVSPAVVELAGMDIDEVLARIETRAQGLTDEEATERLATRGENILAKDQRPRLSTLVVRAVRDPLVVLLTALAGISFATGDLRAGLIMALMIALSVGLRLTQEARASTAAAQLMGMISVNATVLRGGVAREVPVSHVVPGDIVRLTAGDMVPGDVRLMHAKDLFVVQASLTGESFPVEKFAEPHPTAPGSPLEWTTLAFLGTSVSSGAATAVVLATGKQTYLGGMAEALHEPAPPTAFDKGIARFTRLMLTLMAVMVPLVFVINGLSKGSWGDALFFALAVAVGLTPEMLPMIVTICLSKGAVVMGRKRVIVKRINAIQNLGAMDILCTDKTGTLTRDEIILERHCDVALRDDDEVMALAYVNSHFQTGLKSLLDRAVLAHEESHAHARVPELKKVDEIPFDFERRMMSVVVRTPLGVDRIITKGAPEAVFERCVNFRLDGQVLPMDHPHIDGLKREHESLSAEGFRVLALATRETAPRDSADGHATPYGKSDERALTLEGYVAFLDPPKESARAALQALKQHGVRVKVITGDNELVARSVCAQVGLSAEQVLLGAEVDRLSDQALARAAEETTLFARVSPAHKQRIIKALQSHGHTVGFMGDGINDAPALHAADVGISVDTAVDIAKEAADIVLLEKSLLVLDDGVIEGRKVFANITKYVRMGASSSFGNMLSVLGSSLFVPFLPMRPVQILANNLLYDLGQAAIPTDTVDAESIASPRAWDLKALTRFILYIGPCSSLFDFVTFGVMLFVFGCLDVSTPEVADHSQRLFQTAWFVESLLTQTLIIHVIRTDKLPFMQSRASTTMLITGGLVAVVGVALPWTGLGRDLGFVPLPRAFWPFLALILMGYAVLTQVMKAHLSRGGSRPVPGGLTQK